MTRVPSNCARPSAPSGRRREGGWRDCIEIEVNIGPPSGEAVRKAGAGRRKKTGRGELATRDRSTSEYWASHFVGLELRREAKAPPPLLPNFSYASANRKSRRATYATVCSKRATLLGNANGPTACAGTERDNGMLGRQLFGPGGDYHSRILDQWAANTGCLEGATAEKAVPFPCAVR